MPIREMVRGGVSWPRLEAVAREVADRHDRDAVRVSFVEADNWLSIPCVVDEELFVKVITPQNSLVHAVFTAGRNLGAFTSGTEGFFEHFGDPVAMAEHELAATRQMNEAGLTAPEGVDAFEVDGLGVLVLEYLPEFRTLGDLSGEDLAAAAPALFEQLCRLHDAGMVHGDLRAENVLLCDRELYFIDATNVRQDEDGRALADGRAYDLACALGMLSPLVGPAEAVGAARQHYAVEDLLAAREFLDFVRLRPDHEFDAARLVGEIEKVAA
jgi:hypothetical protein